MQQHTSAYVSIRQHYVSIASLRRQHYVSIRQHYVSIRQHYVSIASLRGRYRRARAPPAQSPDWQRIRQHTSAYVSIPARKVQMRGSSTGTISRLLSTAITWQARPHLRRQHLYFCTSKASKLSGKLVCNLHNLQIAERCHHRVRAASKACLVKQLVKQRVKHA
jgi:hypothetical protein